MAELLSHQNKPFLNSLSFFYHSFKISPFLFPGKSSLVTMADFQLALCHIVPSMYRGLEGIVEFPPVHWDDIGGLKNVKLALKRVSFMVLNLNN